MAKCQINRAFVGRGGRHACGWPVDRLLGARPSIFFVGSRPAPPSRHAMQAMPRQAFSGPPLLPCRVWWRPSSFASLNPSFFIASSARPPTCVRGGSWLHRHARCDRRPRSPSTKGEACEATTSRPEWLHARRQSVCYGGVVTVHAAAPGVPCAWQDAMPLTRAILSCRG